MKSGFVSLVGKPNVGKSTILNRLVKHKVSIVTPKAQTTRNNIIGIVDSDDYQIIFTDTPGLHTAHNALGKSMNKQVQNAMKDADILVLILNGKEEISETYLAPFLKQNIALVVLNKIDLLRLPEVEIAKSKIKTLFPKAQLIEMSAIENFNLDVLLNEVIARLPDGPKYYPDTSVIKDDVFYVKEIIREKILFALKEEVPHNIAIYLKDIKHKKESVYLIADIIVNKESQKGIVIGKNGERIKLIGSRARKDIEELLHKHVFLELFVKVQNDWRNQNDGHLIIPLLRVVRCSCFITFCVDAKRRNG